MYSQNLKDFSNLNEKMKGSFERYNHYRKELADLDRKINKLKNVIDREVAFDKELKNAEQRDAERKAKYYENEEIENAVTQREEKYKQIKDLEADMEFYKNEISLSLKLLDLREDDRDD